MWNPFCKLDRGEYCWYKTDNIFIISSNPFYEYFLETFMHEVGHHIAKRNGFEDKMQAYFKTVPKDQQVKLADKPYLILLDEEAFASRFARKVIGARCNANYLLKCFYTYTACGYRADKWVDKMELTNKTNKLTQRILK
jgi:hypothetical protein